MEFEEHEQTLRDFERGLEIGRGSELYTSIETWPKSPMMLTSDET
jgi:hypothetical protein